MFNRTMEHWLCTLLYSLFAVFFLKSLFALFFSGKPNKSLPPGPYTVPLIGNIPWLRRSFRLEPILRDLKSKYGPLITLRAGARPEIFIASHSLAHQALVQNGAVFSDRPRSTPTIRLLSSNQRNISSAFYGPTWRLLRRNLTSEILHPSRVKSYSKARQWVLGVLVRKLHNDGSASGVKVIDHFQYAMFCLLVLMCFGDKMEEQQIREIEDSQRKINLSFLKFNILNFWPSIGKILFRNRWKELEQLARDRENTLVPFIKARIEAKENEDDEVLAYVDTLIKLELLEEKRKLSYGEMATLCGEFLNAGTDTTSTALQWIMANLVKHPSIQAKLYEEILGVIGTPSRPHFKRQDAEPGLHFERHNVGLGPHFESQDAGLWPYFERHGAEARLHFERQDAGHGPHFERHDAEPGRHFERQDAGLGSHFERQDTGLEPEKQNAGLGPHFGTQDTGLEPEKQDTGPGPHFERQDTRLKPHLKKQDVRPGPYCERQDTELEPEKQNARPESHFERQGAGFGCSGFRPASSISEEDLQRMSYLKAVVLEGLRRHPPVHFLQPHLVTEEVELEGYVIPKNAVVNFTVADLGWDPTVWEDPMEFKPERFLAGGEAFDISGSREIKMMPFGAGRRICPGLALSLLHLEYFVANLVWFFEWKGVEGDDVDLAEKQEFTIVMKHPLRAHLYPRNQLI